VKATVLTIWNKYNCIIRKVVAQNKTCLQEIQQCGFPTLIHDFN
jgi:hypothetical protein